MLLRKLKKYSGIQFFSKYYIYTPIKRSYSDETYSFAVIFIHKIFIRQLEVDLLDFTQPKKYTQILRM